MTSERSIVYEHVQRGPLGILLITLACAQSLVALLVDLDDGTRFLLALVAIAFSVIGLSFYSLTILISRAELQIRFGPLPTFTKSIALSDIQNIVVGRSQLIDGFGIHYRPGQGWIWNLWGFDSLLLTMKNGKRLRVGSDDVRRLAETLIEICADRESYDT